MNIAEHLASQIEYKTGLSMEVVPVKFTNRLGKFFAKGYDIVSEGKTVLTLSPNADSRGKYWFISVDIFWKYPYQDSGSRKHRTFHARTLRKTEILDLVLRDKASYRVFN